MSDNMCEPAAYGYARRGWRITPVYGVDAAGVCSCRLGASCTTPGKHPIDNAWQKRASTSGADIATWWEEHPDANVGIVTGAESGLWVLDIDPDKGGLASLQSLIAEHGPMTRTRSHRSGSGGLHYLFVWPDFEIRNSSGYLGPGIDVRGTGGQVVAPPSRTNHGDYGVIADLPPDAAPDWLLERLREHSERAARGREQKVEPAEPVDAEGIPPEVRQLVSTLVAEDTGRFRHFYSLIAACRRAGYTQGQATTIAQPWCERVGKFVGRVGAEVARAWGKLDDEDAKAEAWLPGSGTRPSPTELITRGSSALAPATQPSPADDKPDTADDALPATWAPQDLTQILDGEYQPESPTLLPRSDGPALLYPARVHSLHGESESGKSMVAQAEAARLLRTGCDVLYVDFESDAGAVVGRLLAMGASREDIADHLSYVRPEGNPYRMLHERAAWDRLLAVRYCLAVLDGVTDALMTFGAGTKDTDEVAAWFRLVPRKIASSTGASVVLIDHVPKDADSRGRFAIGSQVKMAALDGAAYVVEVAEPLGRGLRGVIVLRVAKDRPGAVRPECGSFRKSDRTQEAARVVVDSTGDGIAVTVSPPSQGSVNGAEIRPTSLMERVSMMLEHTGPSSLSAIIREVGGNKKYVTEAVHNLVTEGFVSYRPAPTNGKPSSHEHVRPYRQVLDPLSDAYIPTTDPTDPGPRSGKVPGTDPRGPIPVGVGPGGSGVAAGLVVNKITGEIVDDSDDDTGLRWDQR
jgi:hypothetical protein